MMVLLCGKGLIVRPKYSGMFVFGFCMVHYQVVFSTGMSNKTLYTEG